MEELLMLMLMILWCMEEGEFMLLRENWENFVNFIF